MNAPGYLWSAYLTVGIETALVLAPARLRARVPALLVITAALNELPFVAFAWVLAVTLLAWVNGDLHAPGAAGVLVLAGVISAGLGLVIRRGIATGPAVATALREGIGADAPVQGLPWRRRARVVVAPLPVRPRGVERIRNVAYAAVGRRTRLDLYRSRSHPRGAPILLHLHGGHFRMGGKSREARPLLHTLADRGWLCASAGYRVRRPGRFPNSLVDAKRAIVWLRAHAAEYGGDPGVIVVAGSSAGAHLAAMAALTPQDARLQPGFESADTSVSAAVCLYGYFGPRESDGPVASSPGAHAHAQAPPFFIIHGDGDSLVPAASARHFARELRARARNPIVYAELPGAEHGFDIFHSLRFEHVIEGIGAFLDRLPALD